MPGLDVPNASQNVKSGSKRGEDSYRGDADSDGGPSESEGDGKTWEEIQFETYDTNGYVTYIYMYIYIYIYTLHMHKYLCICIQDAV